MATARKLADRYGQTVPELFPDWVEQGGRFPRNGRRLP